MLFTCAYQICTDFDYEVRMDVGFFRCFVVGQQCIVFFFFAPKYQCSGFVDHWEKKKLLLFLIAKF